MCDNEGTTTSIPVTPHLTPLRYVFLPTVDLFHVALGDFAFLSPAVPRMLVKKGTATVNCKRIPLDELVSTVITVPHHGHGGQPDATYNLCLGCLIRGLYSGDAPIRGGFARPPQRVKDTLFVFPVGQRVVTDVLAIGRRRGRCPECDANFKATQRWSEAGVMFSRDNRFQLVSPVIVPYDRRKEYAAFTEKRDLMYAGFLRSNPRVPMWNFELPHPLDGWPVSNYFPDIAPKVTFVTDGLTAVALYQDSKKVRNLLHGVRIRFCEAIVEAEQRGLTGRAMDDALLDSPLWSTEERFVVQYLVWMWPMAQFRPQHGAVGAGLPLSFVDHLMSPLPPLESAKKRVDAVVCKILRKAIPVKGNAFFNGVVQRECMIARIPDWETLRDHVLLPLYYAPSGSIVRPPRIEYRRDSNGGDNADLDADSDSDDSSDGGGGGRRVRSIALLPHMDKESTSLLMLDIRQDAPAFVTSPNGQWHAALFVLKRDLFYTCLSKDYLDGNVVGVNSRQTVPKAGTLRVFVTRMPSSPFMQTPGQHWPAWNGVSNYTISDEPRVICMTRERPAYPGEPHFVIYVASPRDEADERVLAIFDADAWEGGEDQQIPTTVGRRIVHAWRSGGRRSIDDIIDMWFDSLNMHATSLWTPLAECTELAFQEGRSNQREIAAIVDRFFLFATTALTRDGVIDAVLQGVTGIRSRRHRALRPGIERINVELDLSIAVDELTTDIETPTRAEMTELLANISNSRPPSALPLWFVTAKGTAVETRIVQMMLKQRERFRQRLRVFASTEKAHLFKQMVLVLAAGQRHADFNEFSRVDYDFDGRFPTWPLRETWNMQILRAEAEWLVNGTHVLSRYHNSLATLETEEALFFR